jgi:hypothetical protein
MTGSNVQTINELKKFLVEISEDSTKRAKYVVCPQDFSRRRQLTFKRVQFKLSRQISIFVCTIKTVCYEQRRIFIGSITVLRRV